MGAQGGLAVTAVIVDHDAGNSLQACVGSLRAEGISEVVLVDNASSDGSAENLLAVDPAVHLVSTGANLGYGAGVNRGVAAASESEFILVSNPDLVVHPGSLAALSSALKTDPSLGITGPRILQPDGTRYPSARRFPSLGQGAGHALLGLVAPGNRFSRRYRMQDTDPTEITGVDWVSGACFLVRRSAFEELGGFDESYFMYAEDVDLCWRAHRAGWGVAYVPEATVTHHQGTATSRHPYRMLVAHHRSALRFAVRSTTGWRRGLLPLVALGLGVRLVWSVARQAPARHVQPPGFHEGVPTRVGS
jgi:N-acetylglucosaminyl-diphospho-decaprenol L-rhamnosyltransferase